MDFVHDQLATRSKIRSQVVREKDERGMGLAGKKTVLTRNAWFSGTVAALLATLSIVTVAADDSFDMRDCRMDRVTFIDPVMNGYFEVKRVDQVHIYACESGYSGTPVKGEKCDERLASVLLGGTLLANGRIKVAPKDVFIEFYLNQGASPCCGWTVFTPQMTSSWEFDWLEGDDIPLLGEMPFETLDATEDENVRDTDGEVLSVGLEKYPLICGQK